jgi:hypothetical protein
MIKNKLNVLLYNWAALMNSSIFRKKKNKKFYAFSVEFITRHTHILYLDFLQELYQLYHHRISS